MRRKLRMNIINTVQCFLTMLMMCSFLGREFQKVKMQSRGVGSVIVYADGRSEQLSSSPIMWPDWYADWVDSLDG